LYNTKTCSIRKVSHTKVKLSIGHTGTETQPKTELTHFEFPLRESSCYPSENMPKAQPLEKNFSLFQSFKVHQIKHL
jgi:hypothetical protein